MFGTTDFIRRQSRSNNLTSLVSFAFILFFLGIFLVFILYGNAFARYARSAIEMKIFLLHEEEDEQLQMLLERIQAQPYVTKATYISKEAASKILMEKTGENVTELMGGINPLLPSIDLRLKENYLNGDSLNRIKMQLKQDPLISDVVYPLEMILSASRNIRVLTSVFIGVGFVLVFISFMLIINTIRMSIYARRMTIRSMQLVGATDAYVRRPFLIRGLLHGIFAGAIASLMLWGLFRLLSTWLHQIDLFRNLSIEKEFIGLLGGIMLLAAILGVTGSYLAVSRYLNKTPDQLL